MLCNAALSAVLTLTMPLAARPPPTPDPILLLVFLLLPLLLLQLLLLFLLPLAQIIQLYNRIRATCVPLGTSEEECRPVSCLNFALKLSQTGP